VRSGFSTSKWTGAFQIGSTVFQSTTETVPFLGAFLDVSTDKTHPEVVVYVAPGIDATGRGHTGARSGFDTTNIRGAHIYGALSGTEDGIQGVCDDPVIEGTTILFARIFMSQWGDPRPIDSAKYAPHRRAARN
jgi:hypothetical protein